MIIFLMITHEVIKINNFGQIFRKIRIDRELSLKDISEGSISVSFLSKFERGESDISLTNFYHLLNKVNMTLEEFTYIANDYNPLQFENFIDNLKDSYENNNIKLLEKYRRAELSAWIENNKVHHKCNSIMISALINNLDKNKPVSADDATFLSDYLLSHENWGIYELSLFGNSIGIFQNTMIVTLSKEVFKRSQLYLNLRRNREICMGILLNTIVNCLENNNKEEALYFITGLKTLIANKDAYIERNKLLFLTGIYKIKSGEFQLGERLSRDAIDIIKKIGSTTVSINHEAYLEDILTKQ